MADNRTNSAKAKVAVAAAVKISTPSTPIPPHLATLVGLFDVGGGAITIAADGTISVGGRALTALQHQQIAEFL